MPDCDLQRAGILVTRPAHQAAGLCSLIESHNGVALRFPALEILPPEDEGTPTSILREASGLMIFVSPNAVTYGLQLLGGKAFLAKLTLGAVGKATAKALEEAGYGVDLLPSGQFDSEGLLALPELQQVAGEKIVVVRGVGGRALLGDRLRERGADLVYAEVYRRACPDVAPSPLLDRWDMEVSLVTATSNDILANLKRILGPKGWPQLKQTPLLVISERMLEMAEKMGFETILRANNAGNQVILGRVCHWIKQHA
ncbi:MAG: uroporphyrinogen-III synthase [Pseudomonadota bacterium]